MVTGAVSVGVVDDTTLPLAGELIVVGFGCDAYTTTMFTLVGSIVASPPPLGPATRLGVPSPNHQPSVRLAMYDHAGWPGKVSSPRPAAGPGGVDRR